MSFPSDPDSASLDPSPDGGEDDARSGRNGTEPMGGDSGTTEPPNGSGTNGTNGANGTSARPALPEASNRGARPSVRTAARSAQEPRSPGDTGAKPAQDGPVLERRARSERRAVERRVASVPVPVERRKGLERRTQADRREEGKRGGEYDLDADTLEFIGAVNRFKEATGKTFPTWSDLLGIVRDLGYEKHNS